MIEIGYLEIKKKVVFKPGFKKLIAEIIRDEKKKLGEINFVFTTNAALLEINKAYLNHHYYTDVITFSGNKRNFITGDIYISIDQVFKNAKKFKVNSLNELMRVIIHGVLHLVGYDDQSDSQKRSMRKKEDNYLCRFKMDDIIESCEF